MRVKVTLNKSFCTKTKYIQNNNGLPILTLDLWKKKKKKSEGIAEEIWKELILYPKTSKEFYHHIKFWKRIMNMCFV